MASSSVVCCPDAQVWRLLGLEVEEADDAGREDSGPTERAQKSPQEKTAKTLESWQL